MASRTARLEMRLKPEDKKLLEQAAALSGQGLTSFAITSALEKARSLVAANSTLSLSQRDMKRFLEILEADEEPSPALKAAVRRYREGRG